jgi:pimeloyl-ACP methyl ester carboxylesterase
VPSYCPTRESSSLLIDIRGLRLHVRCWDAGVAPERTIVALHGWMDVSASFQFLVDELPATWRVLAPDWRGYGDSSRTSADCYWFPDYLADLDQLLDVLVPEGGVDLVGHSMGGNVATLYAGVRPQRVRRLVNLDGTGLPPTDPARAARQYARWLDDLKSGKRLRSYANHEEVVQLLRAANPRLRPDFAAFLAQHWSEPDEEGRLRLRADPAHKIGNPTLYRVEEVVAIWREIIAPVLWVTPDQLDRWHEFTATDEYRNRLQALSRVEFATVTGSGHMLHHDQPRAVAALIKEFFER